MGNVLAVSDPTITDAEDNTTAEALAIARRIAPGHSWIGVLVNDVEGLVALAAGGFTIQFFTPRCGDSEDALETAAAIVALFGLQSYEAALHELKRPVARCEGHAFKRELVDEPTYP